MLLKMRGHKILSLQLGQPIMVMAVIATTAMDNTIETLTVVSAGDTTITIMAGNFSCNI